MWLLLPLLAWGVPLLVFALRGFPEERPWWFEPRRVWLIWRGIASELAMARHLPVLLRWRRRYRESPRLLREAGPGVDVYREPGRADAPCVVFAYGGAWGSGEKAMYPLLAERLVSQGLWVAVPDYRAWPRGDVWAMVEDLGRALAWVRANAAALGGDPGRVLLVGHSAGGHLWALYALQEHAAGRGAQVPPVASLGGIFDIASHYRFEWGRGVESISPMRYAMGRTPEAFARASPLQLLPELPPGPGPRFLLIHGSADRTAPAGSSARFAEALRERGFEVEHREYEGAGHAQLVLDLMREGPCTGRLLADLARWVPR